MKSSFFQKLLQYFLQGLLILAPVSITAYFIYKIFDNIDNILRPVINIPGIGFVMILAFILVVGYLSSFFLINRLLSLSNKMLEKTPGIKLLYSFLRDFFEAFAGSKKKFTKAVLANVDDKDVWRVGFITQEDMAKFDMPGYIAVYLPTSYSVAGNVYIIPTERVRHMSHVSATQAMKFAVSGGVTDVVEGHIETT